MKILIVDDEQLVRWFLDRALKKSGHEVITASNISEAYEMLSRETVDVLFMDLRMPEGNGRELVDKIANLTLKPKMVVCSAFITSEMEEEFRNKGMCILKKPFTLDELNNIVEQCIKL